MSSNINQMIISDMTQRESELVQLFDHAQNDVDLTFYFSPSLVNENSQPHESASQLGDEQDFTFITELNQTLSLPSSDHMVFEAASADILAPAIVQTIPTPAFDAYPGLAVETVLITSEIQTVISDNSFAAQFAPNDVSMSFLSIPVISYVANEPLMTVQIACEGWMPIFEAIPVLPQASADGPVALGPEDVRQIACVGWGPIVELVDSPAPADIAQAAAVVDDWAIF